MSIDLIAGVCCVIHSAVTSSLSSGTKALCCLRLAVLA